ncbi:hypothetical protein L227DRAFT_86198 [Lentinus tigrinus ALCF2SS1-6]|uniref:Uncharacterized protein n=1 Tax=Lentinus tigrinus ALCF2SS1-6 TaxID=1328759 RepID=A0A5C2SAK0_9APHY|nr:hypothetical protein L227DRAFT_86198 [Lentinus tigrinus ALCF2SS1-6]
MNYDVISLRSTECNPRGRRGDEIDNVGTSTTCDGTYPNASGMPHNYSIQCTSPRLNSRGTKPVTLQANGVM